MPEYRGAGRWLDNPTGLSLGDRGSRIAPDLFSAGMCVATTTTSAAGVNLGSIERSLTPAESAVSSREGAYAFDKYTMARLRISTLSLAWPSMKLHGLQRNPRKRPVAWS